MLRLVTDEETTTSVNTVDEPSRERKRRKRQSVVPPSAPPGATDEEQTTAGESDSSEPQDQASISGESADGLVESEETSTDPETCTADVDLRLLEALLLATHHPLTAGRLAEMLSMQST